MRLEHRHTARCLRARQNAGVPLSPWRPVQSFARTAEELGGTPAAVAHRVGALEKHLDVPLFDRRHRGVRLNGRGRAYLKEVQRILAEVHGVSERQRRWPRRVRIVSVEAVAEKWLVPRLAAFKAAHPAVAIELETNHRGVDPDRRDFDAWFAYTGETAAPRPVTCREDTLLDETLYEEDLLPVCSPALLAALGRPDGPAGLDGWPLLYDLGWDADWSYWFAGQGEPTPDLSRASGFRLYSMLIQAAVHGIGAAIGRPMLIARKLENRTLVRPEPGAGDRRGATGEPGVPPAGTERRHRPARARARDRAVVAGRARIDHCPTNNRAPAERKSQPVPGPNPAWSGRERRGGCPPARTSRGAPRCNALRPDRKCGSSGPRRTMA